MSGNAVTIDVSGWTEVCRDGELEQGAYVSVEIDDADLAVFYIDGEYYAIEDVCTHDGETLTGGPVEGCEVVCPRHGARFCLKTGEALTPPAYEPTAIFPVLIVDGVVYTRDDRWD